MFRCGEVLRIIGRLDECRSLLNKKDKLKGAKSSEGLKRRIRGIEYDFKLKLEAVEYAKETSISEAARMYNVDRKSVRRWIRTAEQMKSAEDKGAYYFH